MKWCIMINSVSLRTHLKTNWKKQQIPKIIDLKKNPHSSQHALNLSVYWSPKQCKQSSNGNRILGNSRSKAKHCSC